jgi:sec-independent protein translocase protein TatC
MSSTAGAQRRRKPLEEGKVLTILEHLQELRKRLIIASAALLIGVVVSAVFTQQFLHWLTAPAKDQVQDLSIIYTEPLEYWGTYFRVALVGGVALAMPVIVYEILAFVGPGLTRGERRWVYPIVLGASLSFLGGAAFAYYVELPPALRFLLGFSGDVAQPFIKIGSYIDFVTRMMMVTGLVFEMPLFVMGLAKLGVVNSRRLLGWWRYALVLAFVVAAVVTPSIDPVTQTLVALPIIVLYFAGIILARLVEARPVLRR